MEHTPGMTEAQVEASLKQDRLNEIRTLAHQVLDLRAVNAQLLEALEGMKCWDCEYPLTQPDYAGCYSCKSARKAIKEARK